MPSIAEIFNQLATRAGADVNNDDFKAFLTNPELTKITIPDAVSTKMLGGLHSLASAEATISETLRKKHHAEVLNRTDEDLYLHAKEMGYDDSLVEEMKALDKTQARIKHFTAKIKELEGKKAGTTGKEKDDLILAINGLKAEKATMAREKETALADLQKTHAQELKEFAVQTKLSGYKYLNDKFPNIETANVLLNKKLAELQGIANYDKTTGKVKLSKQDGSELYDAQNNKVEFDTLCDRLLAESNMIEVSGQNGNGQGAPPTKVDGTQNQGVPTSGSYQDVVKSMIAQGQT